MPFLAHPPLTGHQQHRVTGNQADKSEGNQRYPEKGRDHDAKFSQDKGEHLIVRESR